jgi:amidophosphoribosyltransferase
MLPDDHPQEACGVFAICASDRGQADVAKLVYFGLYALQHRGQESAGITTFSTDGQSHSHRAMGLVSQVFDEQTLNKLVGTIAVGHNRYSTTGSSKICNAQPIVVSTRLGDLALAHNGNLVNAQELRQEVSGYGYDLTSTSDSEGIACAIAYQINQGCDWQTGISRALLRCQGAFSLAIATPIGIFGARDGYGVRPLVIGQMTIGMHIIASETCALDIIGADLVREVAPGELVFLDGQQIVSHRWLTEPLPKLCVFEMIYFARPDSIMHGESLYSYRQRLGQILAEEAPVEADLVLGVPDSGIPAAIGYSQASGIPYREGLIKNRYVGRTFIQPTQAMRESGIRMKLNPLKDVLAGKRVIVIDDSIVRGTTSRKIVRALREAGAVEVHMRISSPPVTNPCFYGIDTDSQDHLIAARHDQPTIASLIEVDSLAYLSHSAMLRATATNPEHFCTACFDGNYPIPVPDQLKRSKFLLEATAL